MPALPVVDIVMPSALANRSNGELARDDVVEIDNSQWLAANAAVSWLAMREAAASEGIDLIAAEGYRTLERQEWFFADRWTLTKPAQIKRKIVRNGETWYLRVGAISAAEPGFSNHGWGLAVDVRLNSGVLSWLIDNALRFGWSWEAGINVEEPWHLHYFPGDELLPAVASRLPPPPLVAAPTPVLEAPDMVHWIITDDPAFPGGVHLLHHGGNVTWIRRGDTIDYFSRAGIPHIELLLGEALSLLASFPGVGPSPSSVGASVGW